jgi:hypothetical protein
MRNELTHNGRHDPHHDHKTTNDVESGPERYDKRRANVCNLRPVKCQRKETES